METLRKLLSVVGILLIVGAAYLNLLGIFEANTAKDKETILTYTVSANIINGLAVLALIILTINSTRFSSFYKVFIILFLLAGLIAELYLIGTQIYSKNYGTYVALLLNLLFRVYYLVYYFNDSWTLFPTSGTTKIIERTIVQPPSTQIIEKTILSPSAERVMDADADKFREQWKSIFRQAREKVGRDNFDDSGISKAYKEIIDPAVAARDFSRDRLKAAASYLTDKSGSKIDVAFGGRRGKR
jgi:hypothetical protein